MYTKNNPVVLLLSLLLFNSSCSTLQDQNSLKQQLDLDFQTSQEKKEMIIEYLLNENIDFSIDFGNMSSYYLSDNFLETKMKYFCNSYIDDQKKILESTIFKLRDDGKKILVVYSKEFENIVSDYIKMYPKEIFLLIDDQDYELQIDEIFDVRSSNDRFSRIQNLDASLDLAHSPRVRQDIEKVYFIINYEIGKRIVPIFRNYSIKINFYSTTEIFHEATNIIELIDFEGITVPISQNIIEEISKNNIRNMKYELEKIILMDFFKIEKIYQNNLSKRNVELSSGVFNISRNACIARDFPLTKLNSDIFMNQI